MSDSISQLSSKLSSHIQSLKSTAASIGADVEKITKLLIDLLNLHVSGLRSNNLNDIKDNINSLVDAIKISEKAKTDFKDSIKTVSEFSIFFAWPYISGIDPVTYSTTIEDATIFYLNKVRTQHKDADNTLWCKSIVAIIKEMILYIKSNHPKGFVQSSQSTAPVSSQNPSVSNMAGLAAELQQGLNITSGLKKVTDDMKTHKNAALRGNPSTAPKEVSPHATAASSKPKKSPVFSLDGKTWTVGNQYNASLTVTKAKMSHSVLMFDSHGTVLNVEDKVNSVCLSNLTKCGVVVDNAVSIVEITNCNNVEIQVKGFSPAINVDKCVGVVIYVSSINTEFYFSNHSGIVVNVSKDDGDWQEVPIMEQIKGTLANKDGSIVMDLKLVSS